ncbi:type II toxin-antitoxin system HicA family toxin [Saccharibacter floricola]|uniref:Toxin-antitoxin systems HicA n=1 Tax=Saccharibacter floricola DSM 15669 TaxID=1123227 RepID=A0ABQ0NZW9_9PROT|nr:type II toxin-antitoxin system HicA family toxin [Saccharibacter floricola]GBQ07276.1 toxin-antitoxin systems HicA [Saccharibacter floricola DSM 15669]
MKRKHKALLNAIFTNPVSATLAWADIEALLISLGCRVMEGSGSRVKFILGQQVLAVHRPHPSKEAKPYQVRAVREFLKQNGATP